jgi:hypothetical protein
MVETLVLAAGLGFLIGLRYRAPMLVVASAVAVVVAPAIALFSKAGPWMIVLAPLAALVALQCGYLAGLLLSYCVGRAKPGPGEVDTHDVRLVAKDWGH